GRVPEAVASFRKYADRSPDIDAWEAVQIAAVRAGDSEAAKQAAEKVKVEEGKTSAEQGRFAGIPKKSKVYAIFALTLTSLAAVAWAIWTVWSAVRALLVPPQTS